MTPNTTGLVAWEGSAGPPACLAVVHGTAASSVLWHTASCLAVRPLQGAQNRTFPWKQRRWLRVSKNIRICPEASEWAQFCSYALWLSIAFLKTFLLSLALCKARSIRPLECLQMPLRHLSLNLKSCCLITSLTARFLLLLIEISAVWYVFSVKIKLFSSKKVFSNLQSCLIWTPAGLLSECNLLWLTTQCLFL